jgi:hypothetical protein
VMIQSAEHFANMVGRIAEILSQREEKG